MTQAVAVARAFNIPTPRDIKEMIMTNERVAIVALICVTILGGLSVAGVVVVAVMGGDFAALALAIGGLLTVIANKSLGRKNGGNGNGGTTSG